MVDVRPLLASFALERGASRLRQSQSQSSRTRWVAARLRVLIPSVRSALDWDDGGALLVRDGKGRAGLGSFLHGTKSHTKKVFTIRVRVYFTTVI